MNNSNPKQMETISEQLSQTIQTIRSLTGNSSDVIVHSFQWHEGLPMAIIFMDGITDSTLISDHIMSPLLLETQVAKDIPINGLDVFEAIKAKLITIGSTTEIHSMDKLLSSVFNGKTVILAEGWPKGLAAATSRWKHRGVEEPSSQTVVRGPKEGFTEEISTNVTLIRRRIKSPNLWKIDRQIGSVTQTDVSVLYINGIAKDSVVQEVLARLDRIDIDGILESGYLEEFIQDATFTPFPTLINTERPDAVAASLLEGQVAILVDGTPFALILPVTFFKFFFASEDYYQRFDIASFLRIMRFIAFGIAMLLPSLYIAITTFHQEMLPTTLLISLSGQREGVPFPAVLEAFLMEFTFEVLREAGLRMPRAIGPAISIVGALVLGQAAVEAGLVSAAMVIVVSFTAISGFVAPAFNIAIAARLIRFIFMLLAATMGLIGIMSGIFFLILHLSGLRSFGVSYLTPLSPFTARNLKDFVLRMPWWMIRTRPYHIAADQSAVRQGSHERPKPSEEEENK